MITPEPSSTRRPIRTRVEQLIVTLVRPLSAPTEIRAPSSSVRNVHALGASSPLLFQVLVQTTFSPRFKECLRASLIWGRPLSTTPGAVSTPRKPRITLDRVVRNHCLILRNLCLITKLPPIECLRQRDTSRLVCGCTCPRACRLRARARARARGRGRKKHQCKHNYEHERGRRGTNNGLNKHFYGNRHQ